jgi:hypothetical protein
MSIREKLLFIILLSIALDWQSVEDPVLYAILIFVGYIGTLIAAFSFAGLKAYNYSKLSVYRKMIQESRDG